MDQLNPQDLLSTSQALENLTL